MIQIIKGTYGHYIPRDENDLSKGGRVVPITADSEPISLSPEKEARLIRFGAAKYVEESEQALGPTSPPAPPVDPLAYSKEMKLAELKTVAVSGYGCDPTAVDKLTTKDKVIAVIEQAKAERGGDSPDVDDDGDGYVGAPSDEQPDLTPEEPVR